MNTQPVTQLLSSVEVDSGARIMGWARTYLSMPHPALGRPGAVCPFVPAAIRAGTFLLALHGAVDDTTTTEHLERLLWKHAEEFRTLAPREAPRSLTTTVVVAFPRMSAERASCLDTIHIRMKSRFVTNGMMLGQFHPRCTAGAVRNSGFHNKKSPVPLFAIRHMALHDILFLAEDEAWFRAYRSYYGDRVLRCDSEDGSEFRKAFREAVRRFGR